MGNFDWIPPAIKHLRDFRSKPAELLQFLTDLERLAVGLLVTRMDVTKRAERYGRLLTEMGNGGNLYARASALQLTDDERKLIVTTLDGDLYDIKFVTRYVLLRLDGLLADGEAKYDFDTISIEHVLPQSPASGSDWLKLFPDPVEREGLVHRLGNLLLLSHKKNSAAQNFDFDMKKAKYFVSKGKASPFALTTQVLNEKTWSAAVIGKRQTDLLGRLKQLWRL